MAPAPPSAGFQSLAVLPTIKLGPSGAGSRVGGLVHALGPCGSLQRPLLWGWDSLLLPPQPPWAFSVRGLRLYFPRTGALGCLVCFAPLGSSRFIYVRAWGLRVLPAALTAPFSATLSPALSVYLCANVGPQGLLVVRLPAPFVPHSASLGPSMATWVLSARCLSPPLLPVWMYVSFLSTWCRTSLLLDFLSVLVVRGGTVCLPTPPSWFSIASWNLLI